MIGLDYIIEASGIKKAEVARVLGFPRQYFTQWSNRDRNIPDKWLKELSKYFNLPEYLFQKELEVTEQMKINLQFNSNILFEDMPDDLGELATLNNRFSESVNNIISNTIFLEDAPQGFEPRVQDLAEYHVFSKNKIDMIIVNDSLDIFQKSDIMETINNLMSMLVVAIDDEDDIGEILERLNEIVEEHRELFINRNHSKDDK